MCSERRKNHACGQKNQKALALLYLASKPLRKAANSRGVPTEFEQNRRGKFELFTWTLSPIFFRLNWTFSLLPKRQLSILLNLSTTRVNMRFRAKTTRESAQGYIQCMKCIGKPVVRTDGRTDVRTDGHVTITSLPKFLGLIGYQISLTELNNVLRMFARYYFSRGGKFLNESVSCWFCVRSRR